MAETRQELREADLSRLTKVLPCGDTTFLRRFAVEYLDIPMIQLTQILHKHRDQCEEVLFECLEAWKRRSVTNNTSALVSLLDRAAEKESWFPKTAYSFLGGSSKMVLNQDKEIKYELALLAEGVKIDILDKCKIQMIPWLESELFCMEDLFTPLELERNERNPSGTTYTKIEDFNTLLSRKQETQGYGLRFYNWVRSWFVQLPVRNRSKPVRILVKAEPGCGKSTFVSKLAWDWAQSRTNYFALVLVISLKLVRKDTSLEEAIIEQHASLDWVMLKFITQLLKLCGAHILIVLDGYDEMTANRSIEGLISNKQHRNVNVILASRLEKTDYLQQFFTEVVTIVGFSRESALEYINKVTADLDLTERVLSLVDKAKRDLWKIPIFLLFLSVLAKEGLIDFDGPFYTEFYKILGFVYKSYTHRQGREFQEDKMEKAFLELGKLAHDHMLNKTHFVGTVPELLELISRDALNCGMLVRQKNRRTLESWNAEYIFTFQHTVIQDVLAARYQATCQPTAEHAIRNESDSMSEFSNEHPSRNESRSMLQTIMPYDEDDYIEIFDLGQNLGYTIYESLSYMNSIPRNEDIRRSMRMTNSTYQTRRMWPR